MRNVTQIDANAISGAIKVDEKEIQNHLSSLVRQSVEETLNELLNAEADACNAALDKRGALQSADVVIAAIEKWELLQLFTPMQVANFSGATAVYNTNNMPPANKKKIAIIIGVKNQNHSIFRFNTVSLGLFGLT